MSNVQMVVNAGSSSCKFSVYHDPGSNDPESMELLCRADADMYSETISVTPIQSPPRQVTLEKGITGSFIENAFHSFWSEFLKCGDVNITLIGHRIVQGGTSHYRPTVLTESVVADLHQTWTLAPAHLPASLELVGLCERELGPVTQVACFDTEFHQSRPLWEKEYPLPQSLYQQGVCAYGFHGLSYESVVEDLRQKDQLPERTVICHLGNGASLCGVKQGHSRFTTMGFSPLDGLPMSSRCGHLDPGILIHLQKHLGWSIEAIEKLLYRESGLLALSGKTGDMRSLLASSDVRARYAVHYFCEKVNQYIGQAMASLGGIDLLVFTGGMGENSSVVRQKIISKATWLGAQLDEDRNGGDSSDIHHPGSRIPVRVVPSRENDLIMRKSRQALQVRQRRG